MREDGLARGWSIPGQCTPTKEHHQRRPVGAVMVVGQGWRRMQGSRATVGTGPSPAVVAGGSQSPFGVEAGVALTV